MARTFWKLVGVVLLLGCSHSGSNAPGCVEGQNTLCACSDGSPGVQTCQPDNRFGACNCTRVGSPGGTAASGTGQGGSSGSGGSMMSPPPPAGAGGMSGAGGASGSGGKGGAPAPGTAYGFCTTSAQCGTGANCTTANRAGGGMTTNPAGYCSPSCAGGATCPVPQGGSVMTSCIIGVCFLGSCQNADCPSGMQCTETKLGRQSVFNCTYPAK
jgi:hypothetical protein